jgi:hypothetical protein
MTTTKSLFEATVLPARALSWAGRLYVAGETVTLPHDEADALELAGIVWMANQPIKAASKPRTSRPTE